MPTHIVFRDVSHSMAAVVGAAALAWTGFYAHNIADLPGQSLRSPETGYPKLVTIGARPSS